MKLVNPKIRDGHLSAGLRNSTDCPAKRVIEWYEADAGLHSRYPKFDKAVASMGYQLADNFVDWEVKPVTAKGRYRKEVAIQWYGGYTHLDLVVYDADSPFAGVHEIKTTAKKNPKPEAMHLRQMQRQYTLATLSHSPAQRRLADMDWHWVGISKQANLHTEIVPIYFEQYQIDETLEELRTVEELWQAAQKYGYLPDEELAPLCRCNQCYKPDPIKLEGDVDRLAHSYFLLTNELEDLKEQIDDTKSDLLAVLPAAGQYHTDHFRVTLGKNGALYIKPKG